MMVALNSYTAQKPLFIPFDKNEANKNETKKNHKSHTNDSKCCSLDIYIIISLCCCVCISTVYHIVLYANEKFFAPTEFN